MVVRCPSSDEKGVWSMHDQYGSTGSQSVLNGPNEENVGYKLVENPEWQVAGEILVMPWHVPTDPSYAALQQIT
jgi:hypothetical protein